MRTVVSSLLLISILTGTPGAQQRGPRQLDVPGAVFKYVAEGSGPPLVVFTGSENIGHQLYSDRLRRRVTMIHADPSDIQGEALESLTMATVVEDIERLRRALAAERISVMGHSMFGPVPLEYALRYPERTQWAILTGTVPYMTRRALEAAEEYWLSHASEERKALRDSNLRALAQRGQTGRSASDQFWDRYEAEVPFRFFNPRFDLSGFRRGLRTATNLEFVNRFGSEILNQYDRTAEYSGLRTPVLVIAGKYDFGAPYFLWEGVGRSIRDFTFHVFERAGHNPMLEVPEEFDRVLIGWMDSHR